jgi:hypothetical protein
MISVRLRGFAIIVALFMAMSPVRAQVVDLPAITCKDFIANSKENISYIVTWLSGYYIGEDDPMVIDFEKLSKDAGRLVQYCTENPTTGLLSAADTVLDNEKD